jgi:glyoxylase-like metal-dependent hydrolase (beta-lactamase superfamily II)
VIASDATFHLIAERGEADKESEIGRFPRLFRGADTIPPGLTWPTLTFETEMTIYLGRREVRLLHLGAGHTAGDIVAYVPDAGPCSPATSSSSTPPATAATPTCAIGRSPSTRSASCRRRRSFPAAATP